MSCPSWNRLAALPERDASPDWDAALAHADGCPSCREEALAAEPTLIFRRLPGFDVDAAEIASMKDSVAALRRAESTRSRVTSAPAPRVAWHRAAAAALLAGAALFALPTANRSVEVTALADAARSAPAPSPEAFTELAPAPGSADYPYIEDLDLPAARVYHLAEDDLPVVFIVDESLDV